MLQRLLQQSVHVVVIKRIEGVFTLPAVTHKLGGAQQPQLMRYGRLAYAQQRGKIAYTKLIPGQGFKNAHTGQVSQQPKDLNQRHGIFIGHKPLAHPDDGFIVAALLLTQVGFWLHDFLVHTEG